MVLGEAGAKQVGVSSGLPSAVLGFLRLPLRPLATLRQTIHMRIQTMNHLKAYANSNDDETQTGNKVKYIRE